MPRVVALEGKLVATRLHREPGVGDFGVDMRVQLGTERAVMWDEVPDVLQEQAKNDALHEPVSA